MRLIDICLRGGFAGLIGALLLDRSFAQLPQFGLDGLEIRLIDEYVHGGPADAGIGAVHQGEQLLLTGLRSHQPLRDVLAAEKLEFRWCHERVDAERRRAASKNRCQQRRYAKLDPHLPLVSFAAR